ncbi:glycosyltransferase EpsH, partial [Candidatus Hakubella thermalkaliphila]
MISVVVPAQNEEKYIRNCLDSLRNQSLDRNQYEIIVVDNASTDRTPYIAEGMGARVISQPQKGVAMARQTGSMPARGGIMASTDAASAVAPARLEVLSDFFATTPAFIGIT